ncbi:hypothetical protein GPECTOR_41g656 [Gonium pectorale]|uniref:Uncharacterized protein n=1 Tax=Gonium pectorale TaxID=33097 RepID=A0A150GA28_GONPE|nr:hypothetical protein GPECTOR_41g656 [Gonium pectorale]|eukprot:KXZ46692.1 hypothetical protein GPECTOR_41g656 [Gonium pectorale]
MPLWLTPYALLYRRDVFDSHNISVPRTWEQALRIADEYGHGRLGPGLPQRAFCFEGNPACGSAHAILMYIVGTMVQLRGPSHGTWFDPDNLQPMYTGEAMRRALRIFAQLKNHSVSDDTPCLAVYRMLASGECLMVWGFSFAFKAASHNSSAMRGKQGVAGTPGSTTVLDRRSGRLVPCDRELCPFAEVINDTLTGQQTLVNTILPIDSWAFAINAHAPPHRQAAAYAVLHTFTGPEEHMRVLLMPTTEVTPLRTSELDQAAWVAAGYADRDVADYLEFYQNSFQHSNTYYELRMPGVFQVYTLVHNSVIRWLSGNYTIDEVIAFATTGTEEDGRSRSEIILLAVLVPVLGASVLLLASLWGVLRWRRVLDERQARRSGAPHAGPNTTLLVTDIQDSTCLWESLHAEVMDAAVKLHHRVIRGLLVLHNGYESATEGDSFILAFHKPDRALAFALAAQDALLAAEWPSELTDSSYAATLYVRHDPAAAAQLAAVLPASTSIREALVTAAGQDTLSPSKAAAAAVVATVRQQRASSGPSPLAPPQQTSRELAPAAADSVDAGSPFTASACPRSPYASAGSRCVPGPGPGAGPPDPRVLASPIKDSRRGSLDAGAKDSRRMSLDAIVRSRRSYKKVHLPAPSPAAAALLARHQLTDGSNHSEHCVPDSQPGLDGASQSQMSSAANTVGSHPLPPFMALPSDGVACANTERADSGAPSDSSTLQAAVSCVSMTLVDALGCLFPEAVAPRSYTGNVGPTLLLYRGLRVRMGMHSGVASEAEVQYNRASGRVVYPGRSLQLAKAVSDAGRGGQTTLTQASAVCSATQRALDPKAAATLGGGYVLLSAGWHVLKEGEAAIKVHSVFSRGLLPRAGHMAPPRSVEEKVPGSLQAPLGRVVVALAQVADAQDFASWGLEISMGSHVAISRTAGRLACKHCGYLVTTAPGSVQAVFLRPFAALQWVLELQDELGPATQEEAATQGAPEPQTRSCTSSRSMDTREAANMLRRAAAVAHLSILNLKAGVVAGPASAALSDSGEVTYSGWAAKRAACLAAHAQWHEVLACTRVVREVAGEPEGPSKYRDSASLDAVEGGLGGRVV